MPSFSNLFKPLAFINPLRLINAMFPMSQEILSRSYSFLRKSLENDIVVLMLKKNPFSILQFNTTEYHCELLMAVHVVSVFGIKFFMY